MARRPAKPAPVPAEPAPETEGVVTTPDAPEVAEEAPEEAPHEITIAFPLPAEPHVGDGEERPLLVRVDH